jgi:hypothetical protein
MQWCAAAAAGDARGAWAEHAGSARQGTPWAGRPARLVWQACALCGGGALCRRYTDVVLQLLERSGELVSDEVWHRAVQLITNNPPMQVSPAAAAQRRTGAGCGGPAGAACAAGQGRGRARAAGTGGCVLASKECSRKPPAWLALRAQAYAARQVAEALKRGAAHEVRPKRTSGAARAVGCCLYHECSQCRQATCQERASARVRPRARACARAVTGVHGGVRAGRVRWADPRRGAARGAVSPTGRRLPRRQPARQGAAHDGAAQSAQPRHGSCWPTPHNAVALTRRP